MGTSETAVRNSRAAVAMAALALGVSLLGVTPADALQAVKRAFNADAVDGLSASKTPQRGKLLALDSSARFPSSVFSGVPRGPRGLQGPAGATGPPGPAGPSGAAEAYIDRNDAGADLGTTAPTTIDELHVPAGAYTVDFAAHAYTLTSTSFVDCQITANGKVVVKTALRVGIAAGATAESIVAMNEALTLTEPGVIAVLCSERSDTDGRIIDTRLVAARVTSVIEQ